MANFLNIMLCILCPMASLLLSASAQERLNNYLDVETPNFFQYQSPLRRPESLRSPQYFDFLSTLYRRDATKAEIFRPYQRTRRSIENAPLASHLDVSPVAEDVSAAQDAGAASALKRLRRAIVFRPLFVYRQQQIRKEQLSKRRRV